MLDGRIEDGDSEKLVVMMVRDEEVGNGEGNEARRCYSFEHGRVECHFSTGLAFLEDSVHSLNFINPYRKKGNNQ